MPDSEDKIPTAPSKDSPKMWRSLDELEQAPDFDDWLQREFPREAAVWPDGVNRRGFLQLAGASMALGGLTACTRQPLEKIVPFGQQVESIIPGEPLYFASAFTLEGYATGVLVESHMGRPTKIEGSPEHPASLGATDLLTQAAVLELYDPDRSKVVSQLGRIRTWDTLVDETRRALQALEALEGARLRLLTETVTSVSLAAEIRRVLAEYPRAEWIQYDPAGRSEARKSAAAVFGQNAEVRYDVSRADVILSLDSDFLVSGPGHIPYARAFADGRKVQANGGSMNRLYAVETTPTGTGSLADHRMALSSSEIANLALALAARLGVSAATATGLSEKAERWVEAIAADLEHHQGSSLVVAGDQASADVHTLAMAINEHLGNLGTTVIVGNPIEAEPRDQVADLARLTEEMAAGEVDVLVVIGGNPVYEAPADIDFGTAMQRVPRRVRLGLYEDETSELCQWHVPQAHFLESWGDARAFDGTISFVQPLIEPLYSGRTATELLSIFSKEEPRSDREILESFWEANRPTEAGEETDFVTWWRAALHDGMLAGTQMRPVELTLDRAAVTAAAEAIAGQAQDDLELTFRPDPTVWDGRFANNGWLQECPKPFSKLTWDNAVLISPAQADQLGIASEDMIELTVGENSLTAAAWVHPGQAEGTLTLHLGYGRSRAGGNGSQKGFNAYALRSASAPWQAGAVAVRKTGERYPLASTQLHSNIEPESEAASARHLVRHATLEQYKADPEFAHHVGHGIDPDLSLLEPWDYPDHAWGLTVDLSACTGCNACVIGCQSENNIPVVGKDQVARGREMHWIRVDRYYEGSVEEPVLHHQPVMCMHCEQAPCEVVCPVAATVHSDEGLNDMVYNRCVGTRYCANNCPYKVRRFNFLKYNDWETPVLKLMRNPDVTVRSRGVMEKCTYCVQRINKVRIEAKRDGREMRDGEISTACQQVCPAEAITFGDINDPESRVAKLKAEPTNYSILDDLGTRPRTSYLAKVRNPNPALEDGNAGHGEGHG
jgi:molybdopterin-containing oxidoreductase family iron-sulfur binding subunit